MLKKILAFFVIILFAIIFIQKIDKKEVAAIKEIEDATVIIEPVKKDKIIKIEINEQATYGYLMKEAGIDYTAIYEAAKPLYDLIKIRLGRFIDLTFDKNTEELKQLSYKIDSEDELIVSKTLIRVGSSSEEKVTWQAKLEPIPYEIKIKQTEGKIETSLYEAALEKNIDIRAIIELADTFQWFFYFEETEDNKGYFDVEGNSVQKMFLKAPVAFKYISSGFSYGPRYVGGQYQRFTSSHMAIDYAAPAGTPIRSVGDGTVSFAGWSSAGYGNLTSIRHNGTYSTNYAHQSRIIVKRGQKVKQGDIIGYVGSTGFSTGAHLHYEMLKNGVKTNPLREVLPPGESIKEENKERFFESIKKWREEFEK